jgi:glycerol-3-phosphate cytidylyltransferase
MKSIIYCFDLDGTLCTSVENSDYTKAQPLEKAINEANKLYNTGAKIIIFTGRGSSSGKDWTEFTKKQIDNWGIKYHELVTNKKPTYDIVIDDKAINAADWRRLNCGTKGVLAGAFDLIHPGYCRMFKEAKTHCDHLTVLLHEDPSLERKKNKPIHTIQERQEILQSIKYVDNIIVYKTEEELTNLIYSKKFDVRFLGEDYQDTYYTAKDCDIKVVFIDRKHGYSTTNLKNKLYYDNINNK